MRKSEVIGTERFFPLGGKGAVDRNIELGDRGNALDGKLPRGTEKGVPGTFCLEACVQGDALCDGIAQGELAAGDCQLGDATFYDIWRLETTDWLEIDIWLESQDFDTYLLLADAACGLVAENNNDPAGGTTDARLSGSRAGGPGLRLEPVDHGV